VLAASGRRQGSRISRSRLLARLRMLPEKRGGRVYSVDPGHLGLVRPSGGSRAYLGYDPGHLERQASQHLRGQPLHRNPLDSDRE
jgi:hypothetical protein